MLPEERLAKIMNYVKEKKKATVEELSGVFKASKSTIRRDLNKLDKKGVIERAHGGAMLKTFSTTYEKPAQEKRVIQSKEKKYIAEQALKHINDHQSLILDSGSTTLQLALKLHQKKGLTVITYDLKIALEAELGLDSSLFISGGSRREGFDVVVGSNAEKFINQLSVDKAFIGADAIDLKKGITNATFAEVSIKQAIINSARKVILLADHTKFGKSALVKVCQLGEIDLIITDYKTDKSILERIREMGIEVEAGLEGI